MRAVLNGVVAATGVAFVVGGLVLVVTYRVFVVPARQVYDAAPMCAAPNDALTQDCWTELGVTVIAAGQYYEGNGAPHWPVTVALDGRPATFDVVAASTSYDQLRAQDPVQLKIYHGRPTLLRPVPSAQDPPGRNLDSMWLAANPDADAGVQLVGGGSLLALGAALLVVVLPSVAPSEHIIRWFGHPGAPPLWSRQGGLVRTVMADRLLLGAFLVFLLAQVLDVVSSVAGNADGLREANPLNLAMLQAHGNAGFLAVKLPAVIGVLLIMGRMHHRIALGVAWTANLAMVYVVISNLVLVSPIPTT